MRNRSLTIDTTRYAISQLNDLISPPTRADDEADDKTVPNTGIEHTVLPEEKSMSDEENQENPIIPVSNPASFNPDEFKPTDENEEDEEEVKETDTGLPRNNRFSFLPPTLLNPVAEDPSEAKENTLRHGGS